MSRGNPLYLTDLIIKGMQAGDEIWDDAVPGLLVRKGARGHSFQFAYTIYEGGAPVRRKPTISHGLVKDARLIADKWKAMVDKNEDPAKLRETERSKVAPATLRDLEQRWEVEAVKSEKWWAVMKEKEQPMRKTQKSAPFTFMQPSTIVGYRSYWKHILKILGENKALESLTLLDIQKLHLDASKKSKKEVQYITPSGKPVSMMVNSGGPVAANHVLYFLLTALQASVTWGLSPDDASIKFSVMFKKINKNHETGRTRYLKPEELPIVKAGLAALRSPLTKKGHKKRGRSLHESRLRADQIEIWLWTASRHSEFMEARLSWIEWSGPVKFLKLWRSKTGAKNIELADEVIEILKRRCEEWHADGGKPGDDKDWILPSARKKGAHVGKSYKGWRTFLKSCGLATNIVPHNIRHTVLTHAVHSAGLGLEQAAGIATHSDINTTAGYVQKVSAANVIALNKTNAVMKAMMDGTFKNDIQDDNVPDYLKADRDNLKKLEGAAASAAHH